MGKIVKFTGSKLLGEELRRLRGGRRLDDVVEMGRSRLVQYGFRSVAASTLSEIENGRSLPGIESVFALSILYQVPTSRFLHLLLAENLLDEVTAPETTEELQVAYASAVVGHRPTEALALATHALRRAAPGWDTLRWRLNRATAIENLGMRWDAIAELQDALDHPDLPPEVVYSVHFDLARMHSSAGQFRLAEMNLSLALDLAPENIRPERRARLLLEKAQILLRRRVWGQILDDSRLDDASLAVREAESLSGESIPADRLALVALHAAIAVFRGDARAAKALYSTLLMEAREHALADRQVEALHGLGGLGSRQQPADARRHFTQAAELAVEHNLIDHAFLSYVELVKLAESDTQRAHYLKKCRKLYPLVQTSHPSVRWFETTGNKELQ